MAASFTAASEVRVFSCPNCRETINTSMAACQFCGAAIDPEAAARDAALTSRITQSYSDASHLRSLVISELVFFVMVFLPFLSLIGAVGYTVCLVVVPIQCIRWWMRNGRIPTQDADYRKARRTATWSARSRRFWF